MFNRLSWFLFGIISVALFAYFIFIVPPRNYGGDIVEYFGINESLFNFGTISLTDNVYNNLKQEISSGYFVDVDQTELNGGFLYYMKGQDGNKYPVHFLFYSFLALPARIFLHLFNLNELNALRLTNLLILLGTIFVVLRYFINSEHSENSASQSGKAGSENQKARETSDSSDNLTHRQSDPLSILSFPKENIAFKRLVFLILFLFSPIIWFVIWPGPDIYYVALLLLALFLFFQKRFISSSILLALASWHSQPLFVLCAMLLAYFAITKVRFKTYNRWIHFDTNIKTVLLIALVAFLLFIPYLYNLIFFGVLTPWTILEDGWTQIYGFGLKNASFQKLFEQFFDPNMGLFWYAPILLIAGTYFFAKAASRNRKLLWILAAVIVTAFFYQTNPAWHYGTSGYGPTRHALFVLPFLIYFVLTFIKPKVTHFILLFLFIVTQLLVMSFNGYLAPDFLSVLNQTPISKFIMDKAPKYYNPTPEIFVDRINHNDLKFLKTAIYKKDGKCVKAFALLHDKNWLLYNCKSIPQKYLSKFDDPNTRKANYPRSVKTIQATFWPDAGGCSSEYFKDNYHTYVCMKTLDDVVKYTGVEDISRIKAGPYPNMWVIEKGNPIEVTIPPGYIIQYYSLEGFYVDY